LVMATDRMLQRAMDRFHATEALNRHGRWEERVEDRDGERQETVRPNTRAGWGATQRSGVAEGQRFRGVA
jgi:hypothetical protein